MKKRIVIDWLTVRRAVRRFKRKTGSFVPYDRYPNARFIVASEEEVNVPIGCIHIQQVSVDEEGYKLFSPCEIFIGA